MSEDPARSTVVEAEPARPVGSGETVSRADRARRTAYRSRFAGVYIALAAVVGIAIGSFIVLADSEAPREQASWSEWQPSGSSSAKLNQIAFRVSRGYKNASGGKLVNALVSPPQVTSPGESGNPPLTFPVSAIAVEPDTSIGQEAGDIDFVRADDGVMYILCGEGQSCSIEQGQPTQERHALLRREALDLALYTFKYVDGVENVTVFLPPRADGQGSPTSVFLKRSDVQEQLRTPLARTLAPAAPGIGQIPAQEQDAIDAVTRPRLYTYTPTVAPNGSAILRLSPIPLGS